MRILLIEDDKEVCAALKHRLEFELYIVDVAHDGYGGSYLARTNDYDLIVLDYLLPDKNGLQICEELRAKQKSTPIVVLTVRANTKDKVAMLKAGADDYVTKPFSFDELLARIQSILRRPKTIQNDILCVYDTVVNTKQQRVRRGKKEIYLTRKEFALFEYLLRNKNNVVTRGMIMEHVWNSDSDPFSNTIEAHIMNLRKKLEAANRKKFIFNVPGRGYKILEQFEEEAAKEETRSQPAEKLAITAVAVQ